MSSRADRSTTGVEAFDAGGDDDDDGIIRSQHTRPQGLDIITEATDDTLIGTFSWTPADTAASTTTLGPTRGRSAAPRRHSAAMRAPLCACMQPPRPGSACADRRGVLGWYALLCIVIFTLRATSMRPDQKNLSD